MIEYVQCLFQELCLIVQPNGENMLDNEFLKHRHMGKIILKILIISMYKYRHHEVLPAELQPLFDAIQGHGASSRNLAVVIAAEGGVIVRKKEIHFRRIRGGIPFNSKPIEQLGKVVLMAEHLIEDVYRVVHIN